MTQKQVYTVIKRYEGFEIRRYEKCVLIQAKTRGDFMSAGNRAFNPLLSYISGANERGQKFAMTAPVIQQPVANDEHIVSFVLPAGFKFADAPIPQSAIVKVVDLEEHLAAARGFRGSWNLERFQSEGDSLLRAVAEEKLKTSGSLYWSRFDPPFKPGFMKYNEVLINLAS